MEKLVVFNHNDNVAVATADLKAGTTVQVNDQPVKLSSDVSRGHKVAIRDLTTNDNVIKMGYLIGHVTADVDAGSAIDHSNLVSNLGTEQSIKPTSEGKPIDSGNHEQTFMGYRRKNGKVGIRNDLYIVPTVGCITPLMDVMVQQFRAIHPDNGSFDNIILLKHPYGCSQLGNDFEQTRQILCDAVRQPNAGGILVFGLGCENNQMAGMKKTIEAMGGIDPQRMKFLVAQEVKDEFATALQMLEELNQAAKDDHREPIPISELTVGLQRVQPDAGAQFTSDRLLGQLADFVNANGGTTAVTGLPNLAALQPALVAQANDEQAARDVQGVFSHLGDYYQHFNQSMTRPVSDGEQQTGVTTPEERSADEWQITGHNQVAAALPYGHKLSTKGLNLIEGPNNDLIDSSAEAAADCQLVVVSAGVATPYASFVPSIKVAANSQLAHHKQSWFDFDGGQVTKRDFAAVANDLIDSVIATASGQPTKNEQSGLHGLAIFKIGVTE